MLLPAAEEGRLELEEALAEASTVLEPPAPRTQAPPAGPPAVTRVAAYRSTPLPVAGEVWADLRTRPPAAVLFASPRTAEAFVEAGGRPLLAQAQVVAIGPTTASALAALGFPPTGVAERPSSADLVEAAVRAIRR